MSAAYYYSSVAVQNVLGNLGGISNSATSIFALTTPSGYPNQFPWKLRIDPNTPYEEVVKIVSGAGTVAVPWTIVRGWDGTTAVGHNYQAGIQHGMTAEDLSLARQHEASGSATVPLPHGLPAAAWEQASFSAITETVLPGSSTSVFTFSAIPQTFKHLLVVAQGRLSSTAVQFAEVVCTVNANTTAAYAGMSDAISTASGSLVGPTASSYFAASSWTTFIMFAASQAGFSVNAGGGFAFFPNYAGSSYNKMFAGMSGYGNGTTVPSAGGMRWGWFSPASQGGITSLSLAASVGNFLAGSYLGLFGIALCLPTIIIPTSAAQLFLVIISWPLLPVCTVILRLMVTRLHFPTR